MQVVCSSPNHPLPPNIRRSEIETIAYTKCWRESQQGVLLEICENWSIRRTAVADKEKFDDEFCSEFKYDSF